MGFYINEFDVELKQHINLSERAWMVILNDMQDFYFDQKISFSGFLNKIFYNYYSAAEATISQRYIALNDRLEKIYSEEKLSDEQRDIFISKILETYENHLIEKAHAHGKSTGKKFRINKVNLEILRNSTDSIYYNNNIGMYLKAVFEEYAGLQTFERERVIFKDNIEKIEYALLLKHKLKATLMRTVSPKGDPLPARKFYITPYKIEQDKTNTFNYLIGFSEEIVLDGVKEKRTASFRISRIDKIDIMNSMSGFISKLDKELLERQLSEKNPQYMAGEISDIVVEFTKKGLEYLSRQLYMRPQKYEKISDTTYIFHCTEVQAENYFFKFGKEALIIEPVSLKIGFKQKYLDAAERYIK